MNFKFSKTVTAEVRSNVFIDQIDIFISKMCVGHIIRRHADGNISVVFATASAPPQKHGWAALKQSFSKVSDAKNFVKENTDALLHRFYLYPLYVQ